MSEDRPKTEAEVERPFDFAIEDRGDIPDPPAFMREWLKASLEQLLAGLADGKWMTGIANVAAMRWSVRTFDVDALALEPDDFVRAVTSHLESEAGVFGRRVSERSRQQAAEDWQNIRAAWVGAIERLDVEAAKIAALPDRDDYDDIKDKSP